MMGCAQDTARMPQILPFITHPVTPNSPALRLAAVVPSDDSDLPDAIRSLYVGTGGDVVMVDTSGNTVIHKNVGSGAYLGPFNVARVKATGTTALDLVGYV